MEVGWIENEPLKYRKISWKMLKLLVKEEENLIRIFNICLFIRNCKHGT